MIKKLIEKLLDKWLAKPLEKLARKLEKIEYTPFDTEDAPVVDGASKEPAPLSVADLHDALYKYKLGLASCWGGSNASKRMMNILSPKMSDSTFKERLKFMTDRGCTHAHVILANGGDGEAAGYAAWKDSDRPKMMERLKAVNAAGLVPIPWIITDDSASLLKELFTDPDARVYCVSQFLDGAPYVVLGLEMDEAGGAANWAAVRNAVKKYYKGPIGVHHTSGNEFKFANLGDIILGQLDPGCSESQIKAQIKAIRAKGKRAVGFEYSRGPDRKLALAALEAGAEGVGNWDGGALPTAKEDSAVAPAAEDSVDFSQLDFCWGGFKGASAKLDAKARIFSLSVKSDGMSYKWIAGGCENLGASSREDYSKTLACLFVLIDGRWRGGKFDWISTSRTSRDFKNVKDGYNGWDKDAISRASKFAFVIVSKDGKKRTNIITCGGLK